MTRTSYNNRMRDTMKEKVRVSTGGTFILLYPEVEEGVGVSGMRKK